jgi:CBS domain-containing protein
MDTNLLTFISETPPFDLLPEADRRLVVDSLEANHYHRKMTLFVQNTTVISHIVIVHQGRLEQTMTEEGEIVSRSTLNEKDIYGPLSLLFNNGFSLSTLRCLDDVVLLHLEKEIFLELCAKYEPFVRYFADRFSSKVIQQPYVEHLTRKSRSREDATSSFLLGKPVGSVVSRSYARCKPETSVRDAAKAITASGHDAVLVFDELGREVGIVTDHDLRDKVIVAERSPQEPVRGIMSAPLITIHEQAQLYEAMLTMMQHRIKQLGVTNETGICGLITEQEIFLAQGLTPIFLMHRVRDAQTIEELKAQQEKLPRLIKSLIDGGAKAEHLNSLITSMSDTILYKLVGLALQELGDPPARFAFLTLGSEGRKEQTLKTDQDNAIIFEDVSSGARHEVQAYFLRLGDKVCTWLNEVGFSFCQFDIMAKNPTWCQPLAQWQQYFHKWIHKAEGEDLLQASIFFDFRLGYGEQDLVDSLRSFLFRSLEEWGPFFRHLAQNALYSQHPLDFFGNFILQTRENKKKVLDLKGPMRLIVDFARIYGLQLKMPLTNTLDRIAAMQDLGALKAQEYDELHYAYSFLMHLRLAHQTSALCDERKPPSNDIDPKQLPNLERQALKEAFKRIKIAQDKIRLEFMSLPPG